MCMHTEEIGLARESISVLESPLSVNKRKKILFLVNCFEVAKFEAQAYLRQVHISLVQYVFLNL